MANADGRWATVLCPELAKQRRKLEAEAVDVFSRWGYDEVVMPLVESYEELACGAGSGVRECTFKFMGPTGQVLALRPDITTPIARVVAQTHIDSGPLRLCYGGSVYRSENGPVRELYQVGAELIGSDDPFADAEVVRLAGEVLTAMGVVDWRIGIGHVGLLSGILSELDLKPEQQQGVQMALSTGNVVYLEQTLPAKKSMITELLLGTFPFDNKTVLEKLTTEVKTSKTKAAIKELQQLFAILDQCNLPVAFDPGVVRDLDYYSGPVFAIYVPGIGKPAGGGGRYDNLLGKYGQALPATGFSLCLSDLLEARASCCSIQAAASIH